MEIINLHKKCSKKPKKASDDPSEEEEKSKKADGKKTTTKQPQKVSHPLSLLIQTQMTQVMSIKPTIKQPQKVPKTTEYSGDEQGPAVKCIVTYSTEDEQEPTVKQPRKA